jgi:uncharacterized protein (TIGR00251 family)
VKAQPGAKETAVGEKIGEAYKVRLAAPPVDGKANEALIRFFARRFKVAPSAVRIVRGLSSRRKVVEIDGIDAEVVERVLDDEH